MESNCVDVQKNPIRIAVLHALVDVSWYITNQTIREQSLMNHFCPERSLLPGHIVSKKTRGIWQPLINELATAELLRNW